MQLEAADAGALLGPLQARVPERDRAGVEQPDQRLAVAPQRPRRHRHQRRRDVAKHRVRPRRVGVGQGRAARRAQIEMVERSALSAERRNDLAQTLQPGKLGQQQHLQMALAGPRLGAPSDPAIAAMRRHRASNQPTIQRFQKPGKHVTGKRHGRRPPGIMFGDTIPGRKSARRLPCTLTHPQNPGQLWAKAGMTIKRK